MKSAFMFLDIETTGFDVFTDQITEIGIITRTSAFAKGTDTEYRWFLKHDRLPNPWVLEKSNYLTRIMPAPNKSNPEDVCMMIYDIVSALKYGGERKVHVVGAAIQFDDRFLRHLWRNTFQKIAGPTMEPGWDYHLIDIETLVAGAVGYTVPMHLREIRPLLGMAGENETAHTALGDAREVRDLWDKLWESGQSIRNICVPDECKPCGKRGCMYCDS